MKKKYDIAAYVWPSYTGDEVRSRIFWEEGIGEWQTVKNSKPKTKEYNWGRKPVWGYVNEADPYVMEMQISAAVDHGVNVFIYDWYWYDNRPFLENCLNDGFLKAKNNTDMKFYIMWANHDANYLWDIRNSDTTEETIWSGKVTKEQFKIIGERWLNQYFTKENYYKIDNKVVVSIYDMNNFIKGLGGMAEASNMMKWLDEEVKKAGLGGVHYQFISWGAQKHNITGVDGETMETTPELVSKLGFDSLTHYQFVHFTNMSKKYPDVFNDVKNEWELIDKQFDIPYYPHVSVGWDNNPRFKEYIHYYSSDNTPENVEKMLRIAKEYADEKNVSLITINSWNEWTETSYLQPDNKYGYGYLEAIKKVFVDE